MDEKYIPPSNPEDAELDEKIQTLYQVAATEEPAATLDENVLSRMHSHNRNIRPTSHAFSPQQWVLPIAVATIILLSMFAVRMLETQLTPPQVALNKIKDAAPKTETDPASAPMTVPALPDESTTTLKKPAQENTTTESGLKTAPKHESMAELFNQQAAEKSPASGIVNKEMTQFPDSVTTTKENKIPTNRALSRSNTPSDQNPKEKDPKNKTSTVNSPAKTTAKKSPASPPDVSQAKSNNEAGGFDSPGQWLQYIFALYQRNNIEEAKKQLKAFKTQHPKTAIPQPELAKLLETPAPIVATPPAQEPQPAPVPTTEKPTEELGPPPVSTPPITP